MEAGCRKPSSSNGEVGQRILPGARQARQKSSKAARRASERPKAETRAKKAVSGDARKVATESLPREKEQRSIRAVRKATEEAKVETRATSAARERERIRARGQAKGRTEGMTRAKEKAAPVIGKEAEAKTEARARPKERARGTAKEKARPSGRRSDATQPQTTSTSWMGAQQELSTRQFVRQRRLGTCRLGGTPRGLCESDLFCR